MASGQIDPARLQGEALQRWYLRSPAEIEEERRVAADRAYENFFGRPDSGPGRAVQLASTRPPPTPTNCITCHGRSPVPAPLPWPIGPVLGPIGTLPSLRDIPGVGPRGSGDRDRKQCEIQERSDRGICAQQPTSEAAAVCNKTAFDRRVHCDETGEIGEPDLFTARRKSGRRWP